VYQHRKARTQNVDSEVCRRDRRRVAVRHRRGERGVGAGGPAQTAAAEKHVRGLGPRRGNTAGGRHVRGEQFVQRGGDVQSAPAGTRRVQADGQEWAGRGLGTGTVRSADAASVFVVVRAARDRSETVQVPAGRTSARGETVARESGAAGPWCRR